MAACGPLDSCGRLGWPDSAHWIACKWLAVALDEVLLEEEEGSAENKGEAPPVASGPPPAAPRSMPQLCCCRGRPHAVLPLLCCCRVHG